MVLQDNNAIVREFGQPRQEEKLYNHVDLVLLLDIVNLEAGTSVAGEACGCNAAHHMYSLQDVRHLPNAGAESR